MFALLAAIVAVGEYVRNIRAAALFPPEIAAIVPEGDTPELAIAEAAGAGRPIFPYSVIEGGARSADELSKAIDRDPVVAAHFKGFDLKRTKVERLAKPRVAHVSYRLDNRVFWTRKAIVIPAGERVLTDGQTVARTRCGNQLAAIPGAVSPLEPPAQVLDTPLPPTRGLGLIAILAPPGLPSALPGVSIVPVAPGTLASGSGFVIGPGALLDPGSGSGLGDPVTPPGSPAPPFDPPIPPGPNPTPPGRVPGEPELPPLELPPGDDPLPPGDDIPSDDEEPKGSAPEPGASLLVVCATVACAVRRRRQNAVPRR